MNNRILRILLAALLPLLVGGCAVLDISSLDTAVPLRKGQMEVGLQSGFGLDVARSVGPNSPTNGAIMDGVNGGQINYGFNGKNEAGIRLWTFANGGLGMRGNFKHCFRQAGKRYDSVIPGVSAIWKSTDLQRDQLVSAAAEVQLLESYKFNDYITATYGIRANFDYVAQYADGAYPYDWHYGTYYLWHGGIRANLEFFGGKYFPLALIPEVGVELIKPSDSGISVLPMAGLSLTGRFGLLKH